MNTGFHDLESGVCLPVTFLVTEEALWSSITSIAI